MFFSLVARTATLGNSCNLHKSKMAAVDSGWDTIGLYREIAIAIQKESGDSNGGNV